MEMVESDNLKINSSSKIINAVKTPRDVQINFIMSSKKENDKYKIFLNRGTEEIIFDPAKYAKKIQLLGAGEILIQSIDKDGTLQGYDIELINLISKDLNIPTLACSGAGNWQHFLDCFMKTNVAGVCTTNIYHFTNSIFCFP